MGEDGIFVAGAGASFTNETNILIGEAVHGILLEQDARFQNNGEVIIDQVIQAGIFTIEDGEFNNNGSNSVVIIENTDIGIQNSGDFKNFSEASVQISNYQVGIFNIKNDSRPSFSNSGKLEVKNNPSAGTDNCLVNQGGATFVTDACGETLLFGKFDNPPENIIFNEGFFRLRPVDNTIDRFSNSGTFTNNGVVEDPQIRLEGNSITNNEILLHPACLGDVTTGAIKSPVQFGGNANFTINPTWAVVGSANGAFSKINSEVIFPAPLPPNGDFIASFSVTQNNAANCVLNDLEIGLSFFGQGNGLPANAGADQLAICDTMTNLVGNIPPAGAVGTWSFINAGDGLGKIIEVNNPTSKFTGTFGESYTLQWRLLAECGVGTDQVVISFDADSDNDFVCDAQDQCLGGDDRIDFNDNGIPDTCEGNNNDLCTDNDLTINDNPIAADTYHAVETITSTGTVAANTEVIFKAGTLITLQAGFQAVAGSNFTAMIEACAATLVSREVINHHDFENHGDLDKQPTLKIFPNPVQYATNLEITLSEMTEVQLAIYDLNGRKITNLIPTTPLAAGKHLYEWQCDQVEAGIYFVVMNGRQVGKLVVVK